MNNYKRYLPYAVFLAVTVFLFAEFLFSSSAVLFSSDQLESGIFFRKLYSEFVREFREMPMWNRFISGGLPFVDAMHGDTFYPAAAAQFFIPLHKALGLKLVLHVFLAGVFMYIFLKNYGLKKLPSFAGALSYMTAPMLVTLVYPGHDAKMYVAAILPLGFNFLHRALGGKGVKNYFYFGACAGFMILSSHIQTTYFALWIFFFYAVYRITDSYISERSVIKSSRSFGLFWAGIIFALMIGAVQLIPPYIYANKFSIRGTEAKTSFEHAISWGIHPEEAVSLIVPEFCGENRMSHYVGVDTREEYDRYLKDAEGGGNSYWGRNQFKLNSEYSGVVILMLSVLALFLYRGRHRRDLIFFMSFGLFTLLYSLVDHTPLFRLAYTIVPGVKMFRGQGMILFILTFVLSFSASVMTDHIIDQRNTDKNKILAKKLLITGGIVFFSGLVISFFLPAMLSIYRTVFDPPQMPSEDYLSVIRNGVLITSFLIAGTIAASSLFLMKKFSVMVFISVLSLIIFADTYRINHKFIKTVEKDRLGIKFSDIDLTRQIRELEAQDGYFRVLDINMFGANQLPIHYVSTVRGFHDNELRWYRQFRGVNEQGLNTDSNILNDLNNFQDNNFLNLAGARFLLYKPKDSEGEILPNPNFMPRAYTVSGFEVIADEQEIISRLRSDFDIRSKVILEKEPSFVRNRDGHTPGRVTVYKYEGNGIVLEAEMDSDGLIVISDNYFPYWHAYDEKGAEIEIFKANLTFRAIELPEGKHKVTFRYISKPYIAGKYLTLSGLLILLGVILSKFFLRNRS